MSTCGAGRPLAGALIQGSGEHWAHFGSGDHPSVGATLMAAPAQEATDFNPTRNNDDETAASGTMPRRKLARGFERGEAVAVGEVLNIVKGHGWAGLRDDGDGFSTDGKPSQMVKHWPPFRFSITGRREVTKQERTRRGPAVTRRIRPP